MSLQSWQSLFNVISFIGAFLVLIGGIGAWYFGEKAGDAKDQKIAELVMGKHSILEESEKLKFQNSLMLHAMENSGHFKFEHDKDGVHTGVIYRNDRIRSCNKHRVGYS